MQKGYEQYATGRRGNEQKSLPQRPLRNSTQADLRLTDPAVSAVTAACNETQTGRWSLIARPLRIAICLIALSLKVIAVRERFSS